MNNLSANSKNTNLQRTQLDKRFQLIRKDLLQTPKGGWIQTLRKSLGMSGPQLAKRLGITNSSMADMESSERNSTITLSTLKKVGDALDCEVFITLIPRESLQSILEKRAFELARKIVQRNLRQMELEAQGTSNSFQEDQVRSLAMKLLENPNRKLWKDL